MKRRWHQQQGMTLLEVLVATAILAVIGALAFSSLDNLTRSKQTLDQTTQLLNQDNLAHFTLQTDLQMALGSLTLQNNVQRPDFVGSSQGFSLVRYSQPWVASGRGRQSSNNGAVQQRLPLIRVRWYVRDQQWYRATQSAFGPSNSNQWVERPMLELSALNCSYRSLTGVFQPSWPNSSIEQGQVPELITCQWQNQQDQSTVIKVVPWQKLGFL